MTKIEVLRCKNCAREVISVDDTRLSTQGPKAHGSTKCSGQWAVVLTAELRKEDDYE